MKVILAAHAFLPRSSAGVEVYTLDLAVELIRLGCEAIVLHADVDRGAAQGSVHGGEVAGVRVVRLVQNYPYRDLPAAAVDPVAERALAAVFREERPDVVHFQHLGNLSAGAVRTARDAGAATVVHLHDYATVCASGGQRWHPDGRVCERLDDEECAACFARFRHREGPLESAAMRLQARLPGSVPADALHRVFLALPEGTRTALRRVNETAGRLAARVPAAGISPAAAAGRIRDRSEAMRRALSDADAIVSPTRFLADATVAAGAATGGRIRISPNGTAVPTGSRGAPPGAADPARALSALVVGTAAPHKGLEVVARAVAGSSGAVATFRGTSPFPAYLARCVSLGGGRLRVGPSVPRERVPDLIDEADVVCVPSVWWENAPLVVLEARARGRPVLASRIGGVPELVEDGVDGLLLPPGDVAAWRAALEDLARDRGRLATLAARVRPPPTMAAHARAVLGLYREVLG